MPKQIKNENSESSDNESVIDSSDEYLSGGDRSEDQGDSDSDHLDRDPDDEKEDGVEDNENAEEFDPIKYEELEDPDEDNNESEENEIEENVEENIEENIEDGEEEYVESKHCHLKNLDKDILVLDEDDSNMYGKMEYKRIPNDERISDPIMTYYEMVRIIGTRSQQFNFGAEPLVRGIDNLPPPKMAYIELISKMTPYIIRRHLPGKKYEEWFIDELDIIHTITDNYFVPENFDYNLMMEQLTKKTNEFNSKIVPKK